MPAESPVFVVMVNLNRWRDTVECIESVLRSDHPDVRVVLVDNGSSDDSVERVVQWARGSEPYERPDSAVAHLSWPPVAKPVDFVVRTRSDTECASLATLPKLTVIANPENSGFAVGNNLALRAVLACATSGYALLVNNDMVLDAGAVTSLVARLEQQPRFAAVGGIVLDYREPEIVQMVGGATTTGLGIVNVLGAGLRRETVPADLNLGFVGGGLLLARLSTLKEVGLFDEAFFLYGEDYDWGERMRSRGYSLGYATSALAWHKGSITVQRGSPFQDYHQVRGALRFVHKHRPLLLPFAFAYSLFRALAPKVVRRQWTRARAVLRAYGDYWKPARSI